jgi:hypothetical protein
VALQLSTSLIVIVLAAVWSFEFIGWVVGAIVSGIIVFIVWRIHRGDQPERYSCPKCLDIFAGSRLRLERESPSDHAL